MIKERNACNSRIKSLLYLCVDETEMIAFEKIEKIALKIESIICELDDDSVKSKWASIQIKNLMIPSAPGIREIKILMGCFTHFKS